MSETTNAYTYEVKLIVQVLATSEDLAKEKLDTSGGFISYREAKLLDSVALKSDHT